MDGSECVRKQENLDADSKKLLSCVDFSVTAVDTLIARTGFTAEVVASMLLILELDGYVARVTGGYCRLHRN
jgi:DNA processing protein